MHDDGLAFEHAVLTGVRGGGDLPARGVFFLYAAPAFRPAFGIECRGFSVFPGFFHDYSLLFINGRTADDNSPDPCR